MEALIPEMRDVRRTTTYHDFLLPPHCQNILRATVTDAWPVVVLARYVLWSHPNRTSVPQLTSSFLSDLGTTTKKNK